MDRLNTVIKGFVAAATIKAIVGLADSYTRFTNSLRVAGVEGEKQRFVIERLYGSAQKFGVQLEAMSGLYGKASQAQKSLNASQGDLLKFSNGVAAALKVQGGSVNDAAGALHQLGQAITGNKIQAEEYNSILDGAYPILQAVAAGSDKFKGSVAALTAAVKAGNVTSKQFFEDFLKGSDSLEARAAKANFTVASSWQVLTNAVTKYIGEADQANAVTGSLGAAIRGLGNNLDTIVPVALSLGLALGVGFVTRAVAASVAASGAATTMGAMAVAARGAGAALLGAFGGPIGLAITGISLLLVGLYTDSKNMTAAFDANALAAEKFGVKLSEASKAAMAASGETRAVGTSAASAEPEIWSFANASGNLTKQLWEQAKAARAARVEMLQTQLTEAQGRIGTGQDATFEGARMNSRNAFNAFGKGDILAGLGLAGKSLKADIANVFSNGRTGRDGRALATDSGRVAGAIQKQIDALTSTPIGKSDVPTGGGGAVPIPDKMAGKSSAEKDAERRAKAQKEFWEGMEQELVLSKQTGAEREKQSKIFDYQAVVGRDINKEERKKLEGLLDQKAAAELTLRANEEHLIAARDIAAQENLYRMRATGATEEQLTVEKAVLDYRNNALATGENIQSEAYKIAEAQYRMDQQRNAELDKQNRLLADGAAAAAKYSAAYAAQQRDTAFADERASITALYNNGQNAKFSKAQFDEAIKGLDKAIGQAAMESANIMRDHWGDTIGQLGDDIGGKWGSAISNLGDKIRDMVDAANGNFSRGGILGGIAGLLGKTMKNGKLVNNTFGDAVQTGAGNFNDQLFGNSSKGIKSVFSDPLKSMSSSFSSFKDAFDPAKGGSFVKGIGSAVGGAMQGAQMGSQIAGVGKQLWGKFSTTGSQLGGALGSVGGPLGSAIGSLLGGTIGGLLKKTKYGTASIGQLAGGELGVNSIKGNSSSRKDGANSAAGSVISGLESIAAELGATLTGSPSVSIGMYKKDWRVSDTGRTGKLKGKYGDVKDFGDDAEAAIAYAIQVALQDGILTGISDFSKKVIAANGDEKALSLAKSYESILDSLAKFNNPIKGAVEEAVKDIDTLTAQMKAAGASAADLANVEQYRSIKLKEILDDQLADFNDTLKLLKGEGSGKSPLALLQEDMTALDKYRQTLTSGGTVDSADFNKLVQEILGQAGDIYGKQTSAYQGIVGDLTNLTQSAIGNATGEFAKAATGAEGTTDAVSTMDENVTSAINTSNQFLEIIANALTNGRNITSSLTGQNGVLLKAN
ncbi:tape measure protein [Sphingobium limneticum]|uniref:Tape measure protein n=1 Tax=Sphingobium limneticum TaxID=1007511 RepID=A0A5J5I4G6_9SPHN|nr:tape measure protein [Sphingobium limneticum]KAA9018303.1 tape measure protein [Sphingobium limneticum]KAA9030938.1 tape measure protein [Sphingobium limneticum]